MPVVRFLYPSSPAFNYPHLGTPASPLWGVTALRRRSEIGRTASVGQSRSADWSSFGPIDDGTWAFRREGNPTCREWREWRGSRALREPTRANSSVTSRVFVLGPCYLTARRPARPRPSLWRPPVPATITRDGSHYVGFAISRGLSGRAARVHPFDKAFIEYPVSDAQCHLSARRYRL